jgi:hypothetical protein
MNIAVRQIKDAECAVDDRQARGDQREQRAEYQAIETLRYEGGPIDHVVAQSVKIASRWYGRVRPAGHAGMSRP